MDKHNKDKKRRESDSGKKSGNVEKGKNPNDQQRKTESDRS
jgi:hypothetical protein